jgi:hypothetical protein
VTILIRKHEIVGADKGHSLRHFATAATFKASRADQPCRALLCDCARIPAAQRAKRLTGALNSDVLAPASLKPKEAQRASKAKEPQTKEESVQP